MITSDKPARASQIDGGWECTAKSLDRLGEVAKLLRGRLEPVCEPPSPAAAGEAEKEAIHVGSPFAARLHDHSMAIDRISGVLEDVLRRLDL